MTLVVPDVALGLETVQAYITGPEKLRPWRRGLAEDFGLPLPLSRQPARVAALVLPQATGESVCFAAAVHRIAGLNRAHLHPAGVLNLAAEEQQQLCADFSLEWRDAGFRLASRSATMFCLMSNRLAVYADAAEPESADPLRWQGQVLPSRPLGLSLPLRKLWAECEMWLAQHPLNQQRALRGQLGIDALWFWGEAPLEPVPGFTAKNSARILGQDPFVLGLAQSLGRRAAPAERFEQLLETGGDVCMVLPRMPGEELMASWLQPLAEALRTKVLREIKLQFVDRYFMLNSARLWLTRLTRRWRA
jgi:hypothetical protein